ncbi:MAG: hypothetical protein MK193_12525 [Lentisphaeria bacterium]|nr:hypothetical protein [Lentisphaeria bacterium]
MKKIIFPILFSLLSYGNLFAQTEYEKTFHKYHKVLNEPEGIDAGSFQPVPRWMHEAGYGIMWHAFVFKKDAPVWNEDNQKFESPLNNEVNQFPVDKLLESFNKTGGSYFLLALNQGKGTEITHFPDQLKLEQNATKESVLERVASERDLGIEIAEKFHNQNIRFGLYAWPTASKSKHFEGMVSMWWSDGWWWILQDHKNDGTNSYTWIREHISGANKYNPGALYCVNAGGVMKSKRATPFCTMTPGENKAEYLYESQPEWSSSESHGAQWHMLIPLSNSWGRGNKSRLTPNELEMYIDIINAYGGCLTLDVPFDFKTAEIPSKTYETLAHLQEKGKYLKDCKLSIETKDNENNIALGKPVRLLDIDFNELPPSQYIAIGHFAVDGRPNTYAQGEQVKIATGPTPKGKWRQPPKYNVREEWSIEIDLLRSYDFDKIDFLYKDDIAPDQLKAFSSLNGLKWTELNVPAGNTSNIEGAGKARYMRFTFNSKRFVSIAEIRVTNSKPQSPWHQAPKGTDLSEKKHGSVLHPFKGYAPTTPGNGAKYALDNDGKTYTQVLLGGLDYDWFYKVDLGEIHTLEKLKMVCGDIQPDTYVQVLCSVDGKNWQANSNISLKDTTDINLNVKQARYIKLHFTGRYARELKLYTLHTY